MFTESYYNLYNFLYTNFRDRNVGVDINLTWTNLNVVVPNGTKYYLNPFGSSANTSYRVDANRRLSYHLSNPFRDSFLYVGHAATEAEFNDVDSHPTGIPTNENNRSYGLTGSDKKYFEVLISHTYTNNKTTDVIMNKIAVVGYMENYWVTDPSGAQSSPININPTLIIERIDPITMAPNEVRKFIFKIKYPMYY